MFEGTDSVFNGSTIITKYMGSFTTFLQNLIASIDIDSIIIFQGDSTAKLL